MGGLVLLLVWVLCFGYCGNLGLYCWVWLCCGVVTVASVL